MRYTKLCTRLTLCRDTSLLLLLMLFGNFFSLDFVYLSRKKNAHTKVDVLKYNSILNAQSAFTCIVIVSTYTQTHDQIYIEFGCVSSFFFLLPAINLTHFQKHFRLKYEQILIRFIYIYFRFFLRKTFLLFFIQTFYFELLFWLIFAFAAIFISVNLNERTNGARFLVYRSITDATIDSTESEIGLVLWRLKFALEWRAVGHHSFQWMSSVISFSFVCV